MEQFADESFTLLQHKRRFVESLTNQIHSTKLLTKSTTRIRDHIVFLLFRRHGRSRRLAGGFERSRRLAAGVACNGRGRARPQNRF